MTTKLHPCDTCGTMIRTDWRQCSLCKNLRKIEKDIAKRLADGATAAEIADFRDEIDRLYSKWFIESGADVEDVRRQFRNVWPAKRREVNEDDARELRSVLRGLSEMVERGNAIINKIENTAADIT